MKKVIGYLSAAFLLALLAPVSWSEAAASARAASAAKAQQEETVPAQFTPESANATPDALPAAQSPGGGGTLQVLTATDFAISAPLDNLPMTTPAAPQEAAPKEENPTLPKNWNTTPVVDESLQRIAAPNAMPVAGITFAGINSAGSACGCLPPDTNGDVGGNATYPYFIQTVNSALSIFNKGTGAQLAGYPKQLNTFWATLGGQCNADNDGDPIVLYDAASDRWLVSQFAHTGAPPYDQCIAVSTSADPRGTYYQWAFQWSTTDLDDYPHFGVWPDAYYLTVHNFTGGTTWNGQGVAAFDRAAMIAGAPGARMLQFESLYNVSPPCSNNYGGMLASNWEGTTAPPAGAPNPFVEADAAAELCAGDPASIKIWNFHVDWVTTANSYFGNAAPGFAGPPNTVLPINNFTRLCPATRNCVPQPTTANGLDGLGDRLMYRVGYRNFGAYDAIAFNHTANNGSGIGSIRWYEVHNIAAPTLYQYSTYNPDTTYRWAGSVALDASGDLAMGFSKSSTALNPSIFYAGRLVSDPLNTLSQGEAQMTAGGGHQTSTSNRWGDYSSISVDPSDQCTFWYTTEYYTANSAAAWATRIGSFKFPTCSACTPPAVPGSVTATPTAPNQITVSWGAVAGATSYNVYRSNGACPGGAFAQIATGVAGTSYVDNTVTGGLSYSYKVTSFNVCESAVSLCAGATAIGNCTAFPNQPTGLAATANGTGTCGIGLSWTAGSSNCGASVSYSIYRSTVSGFIPSAANRIAQGVIPTSWNDIAGLAAGTPYYYIVHSVDTSTGAEETNMSQATATTNAVCATATSPAQAFTATSTGNTTAASGQNLLEWWNPAAAVNSTVTINFRTDQFPTGPADGLATTIVSGRAVVAGGVDSFTHGSLTEGTTYYYALWVRN
jgi:hypothetical protein